jgi:WD40 repeat protein
MRLRFSLTTLLIVLVASAAGAFLAREIVKSRLIASQYYAAIASWEHGRDRIVTFGWDEEGNCRNYEWSVNPSRNQAYFVGEIIPGCPFRTRLGSEALCWQSHDFQVLCLPDDPSLPPSPVFQPPGMVSIADCKQNVMAIFCPEFGIAALDKHGQVLGPWISHPNTWPRVELSRDLKSVLVMDEDFASVYRVPTGEHIVRLPYWTPISDAIFLNSSQLLIAEQDLKAWDVLTQEEKWSLPFPGLATWMSVSPNGRYAVVIDDFGPQWLRVVDLQKPQRFHFTLDLSPRHRGDPATVHFSPDGRYLLIHQFELPSLLNLATGNVKELRMLRPMGPAGWAAFGILVTCFFLLAYQLLRWMRSTPKSLSRHDHPRP